MMATLLYHQCVMIDCLQCCDAVCWIHQGRSACQNITSAAYTVCLGDFRGPADLGKYSDYVLNSHDV